MHQSIPQAAGPSGALDTTRRFVRVTGERAQGFVEFDFAIGEPELFIELILDHAAFDDFCRHNQVEILPSPGRAAGAADDWDWRLADATHTRFR
jgi:phenol hydroxylase P0 protein